jgi:riboflavin synthase
MFTGIIEQTAIVKRIDHEAGNAIFTIESSIASELAIGQSIAHNGVCLTVTHCENDSYQVTAVAETLSRTTLGQWKIGQRINLERALRADGRLDGHFVQGHVDAVGTITELHDQDGSTLMFVDFDHELGYTVTKGSICMDGISLTVIDSLPGTFSVAVIPHTWNNTHLSEIQEGQSVNIEFDILGKYMKKLHHLSQGIL